MKHLIWLPVLLCLAATPTKLTAQQKFKERSKAREAKFAQYEKQGGNFSLGVRSTLSTFDHGHWGNPGVGMGGQFRLQPVDRVNTEWYADVIWHNINNKALRCDYHIGWSVMYYLLHPKGFTRLFTPYIEAGHCFDLTRVKINGDGNKPMQRWSSAVQMGGGTHVNLTPKFDLTLKCQYMLHLGNEVHTHEKEDGSIYIETHKNAGWEGHLLFTLSASYKLFKIWKPKQ